MNKELKIYREGKARYTLIASEEISGRHRLLKLKEADVDLEDGDVLWFEVDKENENITNMLTVVEKRDDGIVVRQSDQGFIKDVRSFDSNEVCVVVATWRTV